MAINSSGRRGLSTSSSVTAAERGNNPPFPTVGNGEYDRSVPPLITWRVFAMGILVSMGGLIFGYDTGEISGFLTMKNFLEEFGTYDPNTGTYAFSDVRSGLIVAMLSIGTLIGALVAAPIANAIGRKLSISFWCLVFMVGLVVQIATPNGKWYEIVVGRWVAGLGVGALSIMVPLFQSETAPAHIRGAIVCAYQLFITLGILIAYIINYGTNTINGPAAWRVVMGIGFIWAAILGLGILLFPESPKYAYSQGRKEEAKQTMTKMLGVPGNHYKVAKELREMKDKLEAESAGNHAWYEVFTGPRMAYRTWLGIALQAFQQLTGANFFFYYGTSIFTATGLSDSYVTSIILGTINVAFTFPGLYFVERFGRRPCLVIGGVWMSVCFVIFASVGHFALDQSDPTNTPKAGAAMIVFACLFIVAYASTWGPMVWTVTSELFPQRYRATSMSITTASNWIWNFLIAFFTPFITSDIDYLYGYVFAGCCLSASAVVYFFLLESAGRSLEEVDTMYITHVSPRASAKWEAPEGEDLLPSERAATGRGEWEKQVDN
ncbi:hexose transporter hxt1 [Xylographa bjoerkii]|nr:hexose transporter hxt1 [Xylographa bjoerkii]